MVVRNQMIMDYWFGGLCVWQQKISPSLEIPPQQTLLTVLVFSNGYLKWNEKN